MQDNARLIIGVELSHSGSVVIDELSASSFARYDEGDRVEQSLDGDLHSGFVVTESRRVGPADEDRMIDLPSIALHCRIDLLADDLSCFQRVIHRSAEGGIRSFIERDRQASRIFAGLREHRRKSWKPYVALLFGRGTRCPGDCLNRFFS